MCLFIPTNIKRRAKLSIRLYSLLLPGILWRLLMVRYLLLLAVITGRKQTSLPFFCAGSDERGFLFVQLFFSETTILIIWKTYHTPHEKGHLSSPFNGTCEASFYCHPIALIRGVCWLAVRQKGGDKAMGFDFGVEPSGRDLTRVALFYLLPDTC